MAALNVIDVGRHALRLGQECTIDAGALDSALKCARSKPQAGRDKFLGANLDRLSSNGVGRDRSARRIDRRV
jgi:hypothetical protein